MKNYYLPWGDPGQFFKIEEPLSSALCFFTYRFNSDFRQLLAPNLINQQVSSTVEPVLPP